MLLDFKQLLEEVIAISRIIIKITISSIVIGLKKLLFPTNSLAKLLSDSLLSDSLLSDSLLSDSSTNQSHSKLQFKSTNHNLGFNHHRNSVQTPKLSVF